MVNELPDDKAMLALAKQARLAISYQAPFQQDSAFADWLTTSYKMGYKNGRADCLQETLDLKKPLLPQELRLLARLLDYASSAFAQSGYPSEGSSDFQLENTKRNRKLVKELAPNEETPTETDFLTVKDYTLAKHMAHRVREALAEDEG